MEKIIEKIDKYELINHIIPGSIFLLFLNFYYDYKIIELGAFYFILLSYSVGIIIGRLGSLIFGKLIFKKLKINGGREYKRYIAACKKDEKINVLITSKNMYRNFSISFLLMIIFILIKYITPKVHFNKEIIIVVGILLLIILFVYSTIHIGNYIDERIDIATNKKSKKTKE